MGKDNAPEGYSYTDSSYPNTERTTNDAADSGPSDHVSEMAEIYKSEIAGNLQSEQPAKDAG